MNEFVIVSALGVGEVLWCYKSARELHLAYKDHEFRAAEVEEFIENSKPGHFIALDKGHLLFRVSQSR